MLDNGSTDRQTYCLFEPDTLYMVSKFLFQTTNEEENILILILRISYYSILSTIPMLEVTNHAIVSSIRSDVR